MFNVIRHRLTDINTQKVFTIIAIILVVLSLVFLQRSQLQLENARIDRKVARINYKTPNTVFQNIAENQIFNVVGILNYEAFKQSTVKIVADDCIKSITVNRKKIDLKEFSARQLCNIHDGINVNLGQNLQNGLNTVEFEILNKKLQGGVTLKNSTYDFKFQLAILILIISTCYVCFQTLRYLKLSKYLIVVLVVALGLMIAYLSFTSFETSLYDLGGHVRYIEIISFDKYLPQQDQCFECFQPPLYYIVSASLLNLFNLLQINPMVGLQVFALIITIVTLYITALIFSENLKSKKAAAVALALVAFYPQVIIHGVEISNDIPFYLLGAIVVLYSLRWWKRNKFTDFRVAVIAIIIGMFVKSTIIIPGLFLGILALIKLLQLKSFTKIKKFIFSYKSILLFIIPFIILFGFYRISFPPAGTGSWPVENAQRMPDYLRIENSFENMFTLNTKSYFEINKIDYKPGSSYLLNYTLKSGIFGRGIYSFHIPDWLTYTYQIVLLLYIALVFVSIVVALMQKKYRLFALLFGIWIFAMYANRIANPYVPSADFRLILPIIIAMGALVGGLMDYKVKRPWNFYRYLIILFTVIWVILAMIAYTATYWYLP